MSIVAGVFHGAVANVNTNWQYPCTVLCCGSTPQQGSNNNLNCKTMYDEKVTLLVNIHWDKEKNIAELASGEYPTFKAAFTELKKTMPDDAYIDDGLEVEDWEEDIEKGGEPFIQYCSYLNDDCYWLGAIYYAK